MLWLSYVYPVWGISSIIRWHLTKIDRQGRIPLPKMARDFEGFKDFEPDEVIYVAIERTGKSSRMGLAPYKETEVK